MSRSRVSAKSQRDFEFYRQFFGDCDGFNPAPSPRLPIGSTPALVAFNRWESRGEIPTESADPQALREAMDGKALVNLHITQMWAWEIRDCFKFNPGVAVEALKTLRDDMPSAPLWVWRAVWATATKGLTGDCFYASATAMVEKQLR